MKRSEKRERENLARMFYTIIQTNSPFLDPLSIHFSKTLVITIIQTASIETPLPVYNVCVMVGWNIVGEASITVNEWSSRYEVNKFKMEGGLKRIREIKKIILNEAS
jgi:hypothetical protein